MTATRSANESTVRIGENDVQMFSGGSGPPLLYLHGVDGNGGWQSFHQALAQNYTVHAPSMPGFNGTPRPSWVHTINDTAHFNLQMVQQLGLKQYILVGSSMGGWVAAEMAAMGQENLKGLVLVDAAGIRPEKGEIAEILMVSAQSRQALAFYDTSQVPNYDEYSREMTPEETQMDHANREMASRLIWKPYLHNPNLPFNLAKVRTPTLLVWGRQDAIVPVECGELYRRAVANSTLKVIDNCGHSPQIEKPQEFQAAITEFLSGLG